MPLGEEGPMSILSAQTNDSDWSDINTDDEDSENPGQKLKIDLVRYIREVKLSMLQS